MVKRICDICKKEFKKKFDYDCHINRKYKCEPIDEMLIIEPDPPKNDKNAVIIDAIPPGIACVYCNQTFKRKDYLKKHLDSRCKVKIEKEKNENKLLQKIEDLEKEINILKTSKNSTKIINNNSNNKTINNNINNNINIINLTDFDKELDHKIIGKKIFFDSISKYSGLKPLLEFITYVHKNDNNTKLLPYKNVKITDLGRNIGQIVKNNKWETEDANDIVNKVVDDTYNYFEVQYETNEDDIDDKPANIKTKFKRFKKFYFCMRGPEFFEMTPAAQLREHEVHR
jgi:hypothetical protein